MKTIYLDSNLRCHIRNDGTMIVVRTPAFDGKCDAYIEGYRFVPGEKTWVRGDGVEFAGEMIAPWKPWQELEEAQREYEREQYAAVAAQNAEYEAALSEIETALGVNT